MIGGIVTAVSSLVGGWVQGKQKIKQAKIEREVKALSHESDWDKVQADASKNSWKDEWLTILVSIPLILAFIPDMVQYVDAGFKVLEQMPEWYQYLLGVVFAASFGIKSVKDFMRK